MGDRKTLFDIMSNDMEVMSEHGDSEESLLLELAFADDDQIAEYKQTFIVDRAFDVIRESMKGEWKLEWMKKVCELCVDYMSLNGLEDAKRASDITDKILEITANIK